MFRGVHSHTESGGKLSNSASDSAESYYTECPSSEAEARQRQTRERRFADRCAGRLRYPVDKCKHKREGVLRHRLRRVAGDIAHGDAPLRAQRRYLSCRQPVANTAIIRSRGAASISAAPMRARLHRTISASRMRSISSCCVPAVYTRTSRRPASSPSESGFTSVSIFDSESVSTILIIVSSVVRSVALYAPSAFAVVPQTRRARNIDKRKNLGYN